MRALAFDNAARRQFDALPDKQFRQVISAVFALLKDPRPDDSRHLSGSPFYRITVGECRVVYDFTDAAVRVVAYGKRGNGEVDRPVVEEKIARYRRSAGAAPPRDRAVSYDLAPADMSAPDASARCVGASDFAALQGSPAS